MLAAFCLSSFDEGEDQISFFMKCAQFSFSPLGRSFNHNSAAASTWGFNHVVARGMARWAA